MPNMALGNSIEFSTQLENGACTVELEVVLLSLIKRLKSRNKLDFQVRIEGNTQQTRVDVSPLSETSFKVNSKVTKMFSSP